MYFLHIHTGVQKFTSLHHSLQKCTSLHHPVPKCNNLQHPFQKFTSLHHPLQKFAFLQHPIQKCTSPHQSVQKSTSLPHPVQNFSGSLSHQCFPVLRVLTPFLHPLRSVVDQQVSTDQKHRSDRQKRKNTLKQNILIQFILPIMDT
jgi:hypothetical protein